MAAIAPTHKARALALVLWLVPASVAGAGPYEDADTAYFAGDYATAERLYRALASEGHVLAQFSLGVMYHEGQGVPQDEVAAAGWYRKAADQGNANAQYNLARRYYEGQGVPQNYAAALDWYRKAAEQGHTGGQINLANMFGNGEGVGRDYAVAATWFRAAADAGDPTGQFNLAMMYADGHGVPQDDVQQYLWLTLAAARFSALDFRSSALAVIARDRVSERMTPEQIRLAERLAIEWRPRGQ